MSEPTADHIHLDAGFQEMDGRRYTIAVREVVGEPNFRELEPDCWLQGLRSAA